MTDLENFQKMLSKGCHNYSVDKFYGVTRLQVRTFKFSSWMGLITAKNVGVPVTTIYVFDKKGNFISSAISI